MKANASRGCWRRMLRNVLASLLFVSVAAANVSAREVVSFDRGWKFHCGDAPGAEMLGYNDEAWRSVRVPHDWSIEGPLDEKAPGGAFNGFLPGGIGWYRKTFQIPASRRGQKIFLEFDGIYERAQLWLNGVRVGEQDYGYSSFGIDATPDLNFGGENVLAVKVDNSNQPNCRWYSGSGSYRHTRLVAVSPLHIPRWGTYVTTPSVNRESAVVDLKVELQNDTQQESSCQITTRLLDPSGKEIAQATSPAKVSANGAGAVSQQFRVPHPSLWSPDSPVLYALETEIVASGKPVDSYRTPFGIRSIAYDKDHGFLLNGEPVKMKGVCLHHDGGSVGAAVPVGVWERRLKSLKEMGCNAIRCSHNPPAPEFLDLCDRMGFLVIDEAFDKWGVSIGWKDFNRHFEQGWEADLEAMIRRDRNHPCVVMWSVGNENGVVWTEPFFDTYRKLAEFVKKEDPTRPVTAALRPVDPPEDNKTMEVMISSLLPMLKVLDVPNLNYQEHLYEAIRAALPNRPILGSETYGYYRGDGLKHKSKNDNNPWFDVEKNDFVIGQFLWTGIDYLGESTGWPAKGRGNSPIETTGFRKPRSYWHQSVWSDKPMVHIAVLDDSRKDYPEKKMWDWPRMRSDWTFPESQTGKPLRLVTYSNCEEVELFLNGKSLGSKKPRDFKNRTATWEVAYAPGKLKAVGKNKGKPAAEWELQTAGPPAKIALSADKAVLASDGEDVAHVEVRIEDARGVTVPDAALPLAFSVEGSAKLIGLDNGDLWNHESYKGSQMTSRWGRCLAIVQAGEAPGPTTVRVSTPGLPEAALVLKNP